jgi:HTH-type transcriptional regulator, sugar sensing transcriptional regulator
MALKDELKEFGLDDKKARVYLAILELGQAKAHQIAHKAAVSRPTAYDILEKLADQGLVGAYDKHKIRYYIANNPEKIKRKLQEKERAFDQILPQLKSTFNVLKGKPKISFYEGIEGIKTVFEDTIAAKNKQLCGILSMYDLFKIPGKKFMDDYVKRRLKLGYRLQVVRSRPKEVLETWPTSVEDLRQLRYAPDPMVFEMTMYIYDNKVGLISTLKENFGMIIESEEYAKTMRMMFEALWQISQPA